jgi:hypothetical protein
LKAFALGLALAFWLCGARFAVAIEIDGAIPGHPGMTYFDLLKLVVTDLEPPTKTAALTVAKGHAAIAFKHIEGEGSTGTPPDSITLDFSDIDALAMPGDPSRIVMLIDLGPQEGFIAHADVLALFSLSPAPRLPDVVEVGTLELTGFARSVTPSILAPHSPLLLVVSEHDVADEDSNTVEMIFVRGDRFQLVGAFSTRDEKLCADSLMEPWQVGVVASRGPYPAVAVSVQAQIAPTGASGCGAGDKARKPSNVTYRAVYRWDSRAHRFLTRSRQLQALAKRNDKSP